MTTDVLRHYGLHTYVQGQLKRAHATKGVKTPGGGSFAGRWERCPEPSRFLYDPTRLMRCTDTHKQAEVLQEERKKYLLAF